MEFIKQVEEKRLLFGKPRIHCFSSTRIINSIKSMITHVRSLMLCKLSFIYVPIACVAS